MAVIMEVEQRIRQEHDKYIRYFEADNGRNLRKLDNDLVLHRLHKVLHPWQKNSYGWDIICLNENDGAIVIVEIKSELEDAKCDAFGQILCYMTKAEVIECAHGNKLTIVRGIILFDHIHENLKKLVNRYKGSIPISLKQYQWTNDNKSKELVITHL